MKSLEVIVLAVLLPLALAQEDQPRYACPEEYAVITGEIVSTVTGVASWEDCGESSFLPAAKPAGQYVMHFSLLLLLS